MAHRFSSGELDRAVIGIAATVLGPGDEILGSLVVTLAARSSSAPEESALVERMMAAARELSLRIGGREVTGLRSVR